MRQGIMQPAITTAGVLKEADEEDENEDDDEFELIERAEVEGPSATEMMPETTVEPIIQGQQPQPKKKKGLFSTLTSYVASATKSRSKKHPPK